jgi:hypothetical protein
MHPSSHILIKSAGRAGSTLAHEYFGSAGYNTHVLHSAISMDIDNPEYVTIFKSGDDKTACIHDHTITFLPEDASKFYGILIKRKNVFDQVMSSIVSYNTQQYHFYGKSTDVADIDQYRNTLHVDIATVSANIKSIVASDKDRMDVFSSVEIPFSVVYYEDFIKFPEYFRSLSVHKNYLNITWGLVPSPLRAKDIISNYAELTEWWKDAELVFKNNGICI